MNRISPNSNPFYRSVTVLKTSFLKNVLSGSVRLPKFSQYTTSVVSKFDKSLVTLCFLLISLFGSPGLEAQVVGVQNPVGGFEIDGNLEANAPSANVGDWVEGGAPA